MTMEADWSVEGKSTVSAIEVASVKREGPPSSKMELKASSPDVKLLDVLITFLLGKGSPLRDVVEVVSDTSLLRYC